MSNSPILSKGSITLKIFFRILLSKRARKSLDTVLVVPEAYILKLSIFVAQRLALYQNGVEFRQLSIGDIRISLATLYDVVRRRTVLLKNWLTTHPHTHTVTYMEADTLPKNEDELKKEADPKYGDM